jgi:fibrillarin-like rRNA methylase
LDYAQFFCASFLVVVVSSQLKAGTAQSSVTDIVADGADYNQLYSVQVVRDWSGLLGSVI